VAPPVAHAPAPDCAQPFTLGGATGVGVTAPTDLRPLTSYAHGGGCACKIPPGELEDVVAGLRSAGPVAPAGKLVVGLDDGDDAAVVTVRGGIAVIATADFYTPVVDDPYDWGRIATVNAPSDVYAMGGTPLVAVNLLCWPRDVLACSPSPSSPAATSPAGTASTTRSPSTAWRSPAPGTRTACCATTPGGPGCRSR